MMLILEETVKCRCTKEEERRRRRSKIDYHRMNVGR